MSSPMSPAKAKRTGSTKKTVQGGVTLTAQKRLEVAILVKYGWNTSQACREVGADRANFVRAKWSDKYEDDGPSALLEDNRHHVVAQRTPRTMARLQKLADQGHNAPSAMQLEADFRLAAGDPRPAPCVRTVRVAFTEAGGTGKGQRNQESGRYGQGH